MRRCFLQDDTTAEEQEQLQQDIAKLSGADSDSGFEDAELETQPPERPGAAKLQIKVARKSSGCAPTSGAMCCELVGLGASAMMFAYMHQRNAFAPWMSA